MTRLVIRVRTGLARLRTTLKAIPSLLQGVDGRRGSGGTWHTIFGGSGVRPGDFQLDIKVDRDAVMTSPWIFACITLIAGDIGKLRLKLVERQDAIWQETDSPSFSPVLRRPNKFQTRQQFIETWVTSKLSNGNAYVLKARDDRNVVIALYVLDPCRVTPLVAPNGRVFYRLGPDHLSEVGLNDEDTYVPADEIIHDRMNCLFHPLVGLSPIFASGLAAMQSLKIQQNSAKFFQNMSRPSGVLTAPAQISDDTAKRLQEAWDTNFGGDKVGKTAVLGDGLTYTSMSVNAVDAQMTEQLKSTAEMICTTFHVPSFKVGAGTIPAGQKVEDLNQIYYSDCLQTHLEAIEALLDDGLGLTSPKLGRMLGTEFELDDLLKMDTASMIDAMNKAVSGGWMAPDEARARRSLRPVPGGGSPLMQQQNYSLAALARRDSQLDLFDSTVISPAPGSKAWHVSLEQLKSIAAVNGVDGAPGRDGRDGKDGKDGKDGEPGLDGLEGRDGQRGERGDRGPEGPQGEKGEPGMPGQRGADGAQGINGLDGRDGYGIDDFDAELKNGRTLVFKLRSGENEFVREVRTAMLLDRGVYKTGAAYQEGDGVTYAGSVWFAQRDTTQSPGSGGGDWRLAVKRGQNGRDAE